MVQLDFSLLNYFLPLFSFVLIFTVIYSILQSSKLLGGNSLFDIIISLSISIVTMFSGGMLKLIETVIPIYAVLIVAVFFLVFVSSSFLKEGISDLSYLTGLLVTVCIIIIISAITTIFGPVFNPYSPTSGSDWDALRTIFHPRILGAIVMVFIISHTVKMVKN